MNIIRNMGIGRRLALGFGLVLALSIVITSIGYWRLQAVSEATHEMMQQPLTKERLISDWYANLYGGIRRTLAIAKSADPSLAEYFAADAAASSKNSAETQSKIEPLIHSEAEKAAFAQIAVERRAYLAGRDEINKVKATGDLAEGNRVLDEVFVPAANRYLASMQKLLQLQRDEIDHTAAEIDAVAARSKLLLLVLEALALAFGVFSSWWLAASIIGPLRTAVDVSRRVAQGDLSAEIKPAGRDETGQLLDALREMNLSLRNIVSQVRHGTDTIATATGEIVTGNLDLSARTEQQAGSLEETASAMEELTSTVRQNADNARQANQLAASASTIASHGGEVVGQVVQTMSSIHDSSKKIVDIISVIDGIAFQTNILALNAAVEAARAGEQGRGFAVVASEVRSLAQRSASAAKEIKGLIDDSVDKVGAGSKLVEQAGQTMREVVESVRRVTDVVAEISAASSEQSTGIEEVNRAITQMDESTQQNAALVEQAAAAAHSMQDQAASLATLVSVFRLQAGLPPVRGHDDGRTIDMAAPAARLRY
ncbi:methyl-accepting chemotaxis protein [Herbaspirillum sp. alder98]|uniref:methyl-accepting chemotaxis protein n=1 Tax=Herbaspirillum sp. alder98 TaxID=2913096 RepID=UPI001CD863E2|nr:methyl-accepting chemotaxis protein [Herbaspirillum sp. alder98]MCA1323064.1 methyl-accepting chemotaxis protein [Herbaspirillum sp. alder98]